MPLTKQPAFLAVVRIFVVMLWEPTRVKWKLSGMHSMRLKRKRDLVLNTSMKRYVRFVLLLINLQLPVLGQKVKLIQKIGSTNIVNNHHTQYQMDSLFSGLIVVAIVIASSIVLYFLNEILIPDLATLIA